MKRFLALAAVALFSAPVFASQTVVINGITYTCTNTCVVTINNDSTFTVRDCCGGRVSIKVGKIEE